MASSSANWFHSALFLTVQSLNCFHTSLARTLLNVNFDVPSGEWLTCAYLPTPTLTLRDLRCFSINQLVSAFIFVVSLTRAKLLSCVFPLSFTRRALARRSAARWTRACTAAPPSSARCTRSTRFRWLNSGARVTSDPERINELSDSYNLRTQLSDQMSKQKCIIATSYFCSCQIIIHPKNCFPPRLLIVDYLVARAPHCAASRRTSVTDVARVGVARVRAMIDELPPLSTDAQQGGQVSHFDFSFIPSALSSSCSYFSVTLSPSLSSLLFAHELFYCKLFHPPVWLCGTHLLAPQRLRRGERHLAGDVQTLEIGGGGDSDDEGGRGGAGALRTNQVSKKTKAPTIIRNN